jgi:hypothetical protein
LNCEERATLDDSPLPRNAGDIRPRTSINGHDGPPLGLRWIDFRLDPMKLLQIDGQQNDMENNHRINVRQKTIDNKKNIACESYHTEMPN